MSWTKIVQRLPVATGPQWHDLIGLLDVVEFTLDTSRSDGAYERLAQSLEAIRGANGFVGDAEFAVLEDILARLKKIKAVLAD